MQTKQLKFSTSAKGNGAPSDAQLAAINKFALVPLNADQVYIRTAYLAHNGIDRDREYFNDALLYEFVKTLPGRGFFNVHPMARDGKSGPGVGLWFDATVEDHSLDQARALLGEPDLKFAPGVERAKLLSASFFIPRDTGEDQLIKKIDAGVAGYVSIGFAANDRTPTKDADGNTVAFELHPPGEALEGSIVWIGAQYGARVNKHLDDEEDTMRFKDLKAANDKVDELEREISGLKSDNTTLKTKAEQFDKIKTVLGFADAVDLEAVKALQSQAKDGEAYREEMVGDVIKAKRLLGMLGDDEQAETDAKAFYGGMKVAMIKSELDGLRKQLPAGSQLDGTDPNGSGAKQGDGQQKGGQGDDPQIKEFGGILDNELVA